MSKLKTELLVLGAGPGGYTAAFYAADQGKKVMLVEADARLGGVCLNRGCIPSKALLNAAHLLDQAKAARERGIHFADPKVDLEQMRQWKEGILEKLSAGIRQLAQKRGVQLLQGRAYFEDAQTVRVETSDGQKFVSFDDCIVAVGSKPVLPAAFDLGNPRVMTSTEALELDDLPQNLLVVGGGYIGMELGTVYASLGSQVTLVEALADILTGADADLVRPVKRYAEKHFKQVRVNAKVLSMATSGKQVLVKMQSDGKVLEELYDRVLVSIGRVPNTEDLGLKNTGIQLTEKGFIQVDSQQRSSVLNIYAIGDIAGGVMLAHKASKEARVAVEVICGQPSQFKDVVIPAVVFTHPEVAWCGLTEAEAKSKGIDVKVARFSWAASGRALTLDAPDGLTKLVVDPLTERVLGVGIVGVGAGDLISEGVLAIEMGATAADIALSVHPHPTLSETLMESADVFYGHATHTYTPKPKVAVEAG